jgi:hypothetical protein
MAAIVSAKMYVGTGLELGGAATRHRVVIDREEVLPTVEGIVSRHFPGSTITKGRGRWQGRGEPSFVVEVWSKESERHQFFHNVVETARQIVDALDQVSVAVVTNNDGRQNVTYLGGAAAAAQARGSRKHRTAQ